MNWIRLLATAVVLLPTGCASDRQCSALFSRTPAAAPGTQEYELSLFTYGGHKQSAWLAYPNGERYDIEINSSINYLKGYERLRSSILRIVEEIDPALPGYRQIRARFESDAPGLGFEIGKLRIRQSEPLNYVLLQDVIPFGEATAILQIGNPPLALFIAKVTD